MPGDSSFTEGVAFHQAGDLDQAESCYRKVLDEFPEHPDALHYVGVIAFQRRDFSGAVAHIDRAIRVLLQAGHQVPAAYYANLGNAHKRAGQHSAALSAYQTALRIDPGMAAVWFNLGLMYRDRGVLSGAIEAFESATRLGGSFLPAWLELGECYVQSGNENAALKCFDRLTPHFGTARADPESLKMGVRLGKALLTLHRYEPALHVLESLCVGLPENVEFLNLLACACSGLGLIGDAERYLTQAHSIEPDNISVSDNLAATYKDSGRVAESINLYRSVLGKVTDPGALSNYLFSLLYSDRISEAEILAEHQRMANQMVPFAFAQKAEAYGQVSAPVRIAYLSGDLRNHPVAYFLIGILSHHDPTSVNVFVYDNSAVSDDWTRRLQSVVVHWRNVRSLTDDELAAQIRSDAIDVLIELSGHTAENRLSALASHPAKVQASYLGYPGSTGLPWMDWRIVDRVTDPEGCDAFSSERLYRLPRSYYCYTNVERTPEPNSLPVATNGYWTFGVCSNLAKVSPATLDLWARILQYHPDSRLYWRTRAFSDPASRARMLNELESRGIDRKRVSVESWTSQASRWKAFHRIDVALDTFPYNQATNTCEALWMGVPTLSVAGKSHRSRMGASILCEAGLNEWVIDNDVAGSDRDALDRHLARILDISSLKVLRRSLRKRCLNGRLMNGPDAAREIEKACMEMLSTAG